MAKLWTRAREWIQKQNPRLNLDIAPRKISTVLEILQTQEATEEAKDHVFYDALKRISASKVSWLTFPRITFLLFVPVENASRSVL